MINNKLNYKFMHLQNRFLILLQILGQNLINIFLICKY